jgi:hypothetical protein
LALKKGSLKGFSESTDRIGEDMVKHAGAMLVANPQRRRSLTLV